MISLIMRCTALLTLLFPTLLLLGASPVHSSSEYKPADPKADRQVRRLLNYFKEQQSKGLISGQTDYGDAVWIEKNTGKLPAILGLDFMHTPARMGHQVQDTAVAIDWLKNRHGIVTYQWHWSSPSGAKDAGSGFYTGKTTFDFALALRNTKSADYQGLVRDIDDVAMEIKKLSNAKVPIIFRPLHEAQGGWFWWGSKGSGNCVALYRLIFERLTKHHRLHNIVWAWTAYPQSQGKGDPKDWYPGNTMVDIVVSDYCESKKDYDDLVRLTEGRKMVALAETMNAPDPDKVLNETPWAYWVTWARRDWHASSNDDMKRAMSRSRTITLDQLPDLAKH